MLKAGLSAVLFAVAVAQGPREFVELDVAALDHQELPVTNLTQADFQVKDDGTVVPLQTFTVVAAPGDFSDERFVVLLMDDIGVTLAGTSPMRQIGQVLLSPAQAGDETGVVRLSHPRDEAFGDVESALERIEQYHGGAVPYSPLDTPEAMLRTVARIAQQLESVQHRRKVILCLGPTSVCNLQEPNFRSTMAYQDLWMSALSSAARANVSVYEVDPTGLSQSSRVSTTGLMRLTGGDVLHNTNDFRAAATRVWRAASHYYLIGYWAAPSSRRPLHSIDVTTSRRDVHLEARRFR